MVQILGGRNPTTTQNKKVPGENQGQQHNILDEESLVDKNRIQQWVDRAIGNFPARETENRSWAPSTTTTTTFALSNPNVVPTSNFAQDFAQAHQKSHDASSPLLLTAIENPNTTDFDKAFAAELNQLTFQEREKTWDEIHGVAPIQEETQDFVRAKVLELQEVIFHTPLDRKRAYLEASNDPESRFYVTSIRFQIQFLRAERFDVLLAAKRMLLCCEKRVQFFGRQTLRRPLCLCDLSAEELRTLKGGAFQVLSERDRSGRLVVIDTSLCGPKLYTSLFAYYKCFWYIIMSVMEDDEETQKRGIVAIVWWMHHPLRLDQDFDNDLRQETIASLNWLPMRPYSSTHVCIDYNHATMKQIMARFMMAVSPKNMRYGIQLHRGTYTEVLYKLLTYGVPVDSIPVSSSGTVKTKNFGRWIQRQRQKEEYLLLLPSNKNNHHKKQRQKQTTKELSSTSMVDQSSNDQSATTTMTEPNQDNHPVAGWFAEDRIDLPSNRDVLLGTGKPLMKHPGNQDFRTIVENLLSMYDSTPSLRDKAEVTWGVVRYIQENQGGRFLKRESDGDWWQVVSNQEARDKTGKAFVNQRESRKAKRSSTSATIPTNGSGTTSTSGGPSRSAAMTDTSMTTMLREENLTSSTNDTANRRGEAVVWGGSLPLRPIREARNSTNSMMNNTASSSHKKRRRDGGSNISDSCFAWCGGSGEGTTSSSSTTTSFSTSFLDGTGM